MRAKRVGVRWGMFAAGFALIGASACATQEQVDQMSNELQQMRAQSVRREAALEQRLASLQEELEHEGSASERSEMADSMHQLAASNDALRQTLAARGGAPESWAPNQGRHAAAVQPSDDEAELRQLVRQLRQIVHGRGALTPYQQQLLLRALRPQRELDRDNPWGPKLDRTNPWEPARNANDDWDPRIDRGNPWH